MREWIRKMRGDRKISQKMLADNIGVTTQSISLIENGERQKDMSYQMMRKLASAFDVPVQTIIDAETEYQKDVGNDVFVK